MSGGPETLYHNVSLLTQPKSIPVITGPSLFSPLMLIACDVVSETVYEYVLPDRPCDDVPSMTSVPCELSMHMPLYWLGKFLLSSKLSSSDSLSPKV